MTYMPILKGKEGEYGALEELGLDVRTDIVPLIEVPEVPYDFVNEKPSKTLLDHIAGIGERLARCWRQRELYLHLPWCRGTDADETLSSGEHALSHVLEDCRRRGIAVSPVVSTLNTPAYLASVRSTLSAQSSRLCLRLTLDDFDEDREEPLQDIVDRVLASAGAQRASHVDVLIDMGEIRNDSTILARAVIAERPKNIGNGRVIFAAASFPENLSDISRASIEPLPRHEWNLWTKLRAKKTLDDQAVFGDYGISNPSVVPIDPRTMRMSANIRYTTRDAWLVLKGKNVRDWGFDQYYELCRALIDRPEYLGRTFSWGDRFIRDCAYKATGPGNATTWRKVGTNHHLTLVAKALSNQLGA